MQPFRAGILGATGLVGQRLVDRLRGHPWFTTTALAGSSRSAGRAFGEAARWVLPTAIPAGVAEERVRPCEVDALSDCDVVFSALDTAIARELEPEFRRAGFAVVSNSSAFRQDPEVPLMIPEINPEHLGLVEAQRARYGGFLVTNPNCSVTGLAVALAPIAREFGIRRAIVATLQATSGAGMDGPRALELTDNVLPYISGEEDKLETELQKIFGRFAEGRVERYAVAVSAHCHRVAVVDGHLEAVSFELERAAEPERVRECLAGFRGAVADLGLPSAAAPLAIRAEEDRPQPRLDRDAGGGMTVVVGRIRACPVLGVKMAVLSHNAVRGAAGGTLLNAELLAAKGLLPRRSSS